MGKEKGGVNMTRLVIVSVKPIGDRAAELTIRHNKEILFYALFISLSAAYSEGGRWLTKNRCHLDNKGNWYSEVAFVTKLDPNNLLLEQRERRWVEPYRKIAVKRLL